MYNKNNNQNKEHLGKFLSYYNKQQTEEDIEDFIDTELELELQLLMNTDGRTKVPSYE